MLPATPTRLTAAGYGVRDRTSTPAHSAHAGNGSGRVRAWATRLQTEEAAEAMTFDGVGPETLVGLVDA
jgi:hypothetical protein